MVLKDMLHDSGLPALRGPVKVWVVDNYRDNTWFIFRRRQFIPFGSGDNFKEVTTRTWSIIFMTRVTGSFVLQEVAQMRAITGRQLLIISCFITVSWSPVPYSRIRRIIIRELMIFSIEDKIAYNPKAMGVLLYVAQWCETFCLYRGRAYGSPVDIVTRWKIREWRGDFLLENGVDYVTSISKSFVGRVFVYRVDW